MSQQLVSSASHCTHKLDTVKEPSATTTTLVPTPGVNRKWFEATMPNVGSTR